MVLLGLQLVLQCDRLVLLESDSGELMHWLWLRIDVQGTLFGRLLQVTLSNNPVPFTLILGRARLEIAIKSCIWSCQACTIIGHAEVSPTRRSFVRYHDRHALPFTLVYEFHFWHRCLSDHLHHNFHMVSEHKKFQLQGFHLGFLPCFRPWESHPIWVVACHKDLLVCCHLKMSLLQGVYYICNPLTKQWLNLPPSPGHHRVADTAIGFITSEKSVSLNSFKLVQVPKLDSCFSNGNCFEVNVFSSEVGEWRNFKITSPQSFTRTWQFRPESITVKNKFHWLVNSSNIVVVDPFELAEGSCRVIELPSELNPDIGICLGSCQDYLRVCQIFRGWSNCLLVVWKLLDYVTGNWDLEYEISLKEMAFFENVCLHKFGFSTMEALAFHPVDFGILYLRFNNQIVMCDVGKRTLEVVSECLQDSSFSVGTCGVFLLMHPCWPSLIPSSLPLS